MTIRKQGWTGAHVGGAPTVGGVHRPAVTCSTSLPRRSTSSGAGNFGCFRLTAAVFLSHARRLTLGFRAGRLSGHELAPGRLFQPTDHVPAKFADRSKHPSVLSSSPVAVEGNLDPKGFRIVRTAFREAGNVFRG